MTVGINGAYIEFRLSGGSGNTDPDASLGGVMSSEKISSQSASAASNVTGVTFLFASANTEGVGTLTYVDSTSSLQWTPPGGTIGVAVTVAEDGRYRLFGAGNLGLVIVDVDFSSLPATDQADSITIANVLNELFDNISGSQSLDGHIDYRCYYIYNAHPTEDFIRWNPFIGSNPTPGSLAFGKDPAGKGNGSTTGVATTIANETTAPAGVTFSTATNEPAAVSAGQSIIGPIAAGEAQAIWVKRSIAPLNTTQNPESTALVQVSAYYEI